MIKYKLNCHSVVNNGILLKMKIKYFKYIKLSIAILFLVMLSCEKDDICSEGTSTTARLFIEFYDISNQESLKNIFNFRVQGVGNENVLSGYNIVTSSQVLLPLKTDEGITQYKLHNDYGIDNNGTPDDTSDDIITGNEDIITVTYNTEEVYVSRACGFKTVFTNITIAVENDGDNWIQLIQPLNDNQSVIDETTAHFKIFH